MIYYEVHENGTILKAFRKAYMLDPALDKIDEENKVLQMQILGDVNSMKIHGKFDGKYWETTGFEFPDEAAVSMFLLRWS